MFSSGKSNRGEAAGGENESESFLRSTTSGGGLEEAAVATLLRNRLRVPTGPGDGGRHQGQWSSSMAAHGGGAARRVRVGRACLYCVCYPSLFPYGRGDPTNPRRRHAVRYSDGRVRAPPEVILRRLRRAATLSVYGTPTIPSLAPKRAGTASDPQPGLHEPKAL